MRSYPTIQASVTHTDSVHATSRCATTVSVPRQASIHCSNGIPYPRAGSTLVDQVGNSHTFCRLCSEIVHNANTEASGSENQLVPISSGLAGSMNTTTFISLIYVGVGWLVWQRRLY